MKAPTDKMKAVILARVSTKRQETEGLSLDHQLKKLRGYAEERGFEIVEEFVFQESADQKIRKRFDAMFDYVKQDKEIVAILAFRVDRMTRNYRDAVLMDTLRVEHNRELHFVEDRLVLKPDSVGRDIQDWDLKVFLAKQYINRLKEDGVNTAKYKILNGEWCGKAPCGYVNVALDRNKKWIELDKVRTPLIRQAFELYATGKYSFKDLANEMTRRGLTINSKSSAPVSRSHLFEILEDPFYYGEMQFKGKLYPHGYEPIITKWLFDKCQQVKENWNKKPFKYGAKDFVFKGIIQCSSCGGLLSTYTKKGFNYVRCHGCKAVHVRENVFVSEIAKLFKSMKISDGKLEELKVKLHKNHEEEQKFYKSNVDRIKKRLNVLEQRKEQMYFDKLDGRITSDEYDKFIKKFKQEECEQIESLQDHSKADEAFLLTSSYLLDLASRAYDLFMSSQPAQKNALLKFVLANVKADGEKLYVQLKNTFAGILLANKSNNWLPGTDSNRRPIGYTCPYISVGVDYIITISFEI